MIKTKVAFWRAGFFSANQGFLKTFQIVLIEWIKAGPQKSHFCFDYVNWLIMTDLVDKLHVINCLN